MKDPIACAARWLAAVGLAAAALTCAGEPDNAGADALAEAGVDTTPTLPLLGSGATVKGIAARAAGGFPAVVTLEPANASAAPQRNNAVPPTTPPAPSFMDQAGSSFYPPTLLTRVGQPVQFSNSENVMHNVTVSSDGTEALVFNVATPPGFEPYRHAFNAPGVYRVTCSIHPGMSAFIVTVATPYAAVADRNGAYAIHGVPPGRYEAAVWSLDPSLRVERPVEIPAESAAFTLDLAPATGTDAPIDRTQ
jgi:plastocyanin